LKSFPKEFLINSLDKIIANILSATNGVLGIK